MYLSMLNEQEKIGFYSLAHALAQSHQGISDEERNVLVASAKEMELTPPHVVLDVHAACATFLSNTSKRVAILELALLALVDDDYAAEEQIILNEVVSAFALSDSQVSRVMGLAEAILAQYRSGKRFIES